MLLDNKNRSNITIYLNSSFFSNYCIKLIPPGPQCLAGDLLQGEKIPIQWHSCLSHFIKKKIHYGLGIRFKKNLYKRIDFQLLDIIWSIVMAEDFVKKTSDEKV